MMTTQLTVADLRAAGYSVSRGAYVGACEDNIDRWYIDRQDSTTLDRRGPGYATRSDAVASMADTVRVLRLPVIGRVVVRVIGDGDDCRVADCHIARCVTARRLAHLAELGASAARHESGWWPAVQDAAPEYVRTALEIDYDSLPWGDTRAEAELAIYNAILQESARQALWAESVL